MHVAPHGLQRDVEAFGKFSIVAEPWARTISIKALCLGFSVMRMIKQQKRKIMTHCKIVFCSLLSKTHKNESNMKDPLIRA